MGVVSLNKIHTRLPGMGVVSLNKIHTRLPGMGVVTQNKILVHTYLPMVQIFGFNVNP